MGDNFFPIFFGVIMVLGVISLFILLVIVPLVSQNELEEWCIEEGYDSGRYGKYTWDESYCIKQENNTIIKLQVEACSPRGGWCFVKEMS